MTSQESRTSTLPSRRVVVAASDLFGMLNLQSELEQVGLKVVGCAADGAQAVRAARILSPDAVILDHSLRRQNALDPARDIFRARLAPVLVLSPCASAANRPADSSPVAAYLTKPLHRADVLPVIEVAVARWQAMVEMEKRIARLERQLESREAVDSAKCMLMDQFGWREADAYRYLQALSMNTRKPMTVIAERVLSGSIAVAATPIAAKAVA